MGSHRFIGKHSTHTIDRLAEQWLDGRCATEIEMCEPPPRAQCVAGRCVELPPDPIPSHWRRMETLGTFWFYVPPELRENEVSIEDSYVREWSNTTMRLALDYGSHNGPLEVPKAGAGSDAEVEDLVISGVPARFLRLDNQPGEHPVSIALHFTEPPPCSTSSCQVRVRRPATLAIHASCRDDVTCDVAERIVRSTRFRTQLAK